MALKFTNDAEQGKLCLLAAKILKFALFPGETASWGSYSPKDITVFHKERYEAMKSKENHY
jgi:hypothetical protein